MLPTGLKISFSKFDKAYEKSIDGPQLVKSGDCKSLLVIQTLQVIFSLTLIFNLKFT